LARPRAVKWLLRLMPEPSSRWMVSASSPHRHSSKCSEIDCLAEYAVRSEMVSRAALPAICDLQGDFQKLQGEPIRWLRNLPIISRGRKELSLLAEQGAFFGIAGKSSVELRL
jgi:hypothetical protein